MEKIIEKLNTKGTAQLKQMAQLLMTNSDEGAGVVFVAVLNVLEARMKESDFVAFCDNL